jgi:hypothetical protein
MLRSLLVAMAVVSLAAPAGATVVTVLGTAGPWSTSANPSFTYADDSAETAPTAVAITPGQSYVIQYVSGLTTTDGVTQVDANGFCCVLGPSFNSPGQYTNTAPLLNELVGTFADASGVIVGTPFTIGDGPLTELAPAGASALQLGINDNEYHDNTGFLNISVAPAPEAASWAMMLVGVGIVGTLMRIRRRKDSPAFGAA